MAGLGTRGDAVWQPRPFQVQRQASGQEFLDILVWNLPRPVTRLSSAGSLMHYRPESAGPETHYRKRGTFEDRLGEFNESIGVHLSSQGFQENEATMLLALLAFNLNTICRNELEDSVGGSWDMRRFVLFVLKVGGEMVKHARRLVLRVAESAQPLWSRLIGRLKSWQWKPGQAGQLHGFTPPPRHAHLKEVLRC